PRTARRTAPPPWLPARPRTPTAPSARRSGRSRGVTRAGGTSAPPGACWTSGRLLAGRGPPGRRRPVRAPASLAKWLFFQTRPAGPSLTGWTGCPIPRRGALHDSLGNTSPACTAPSPLGGKVGMGHGRRRADGARPGRFMPAGVPPRAPRAAPLLLPPLAGGGGGDAAGGQTAGREAGSAAAGCPHPSPPPQAGEGANPGKSGAGEERTQGRADTGRTLLRRDPDRAGRRALAPSPARGGRSGWGHAAGGQTAGRRPDRRRPGAPTPALPRKRERRSE